MNADRRRRRPSAAFLHRALVAPWQSKARGVFYIAVFLGIFGFDLTSLLFSHNLATGSAADLFHFWGIFFVVSGIVFPPLLFGGYCRMTLGRARLLFAAVAAAGVACFVLMPHELLPLAVANSLVSMPFWAAYHIALFAHSTDDNRGHEISVAYIVTAIAAAVGYGFGGLVGNNGYGCIALGFAALGGGTLLLLYVMQAPTARQAEKFWAQLRGFLVRPGRLQIASLASGGHDVLGGFLLPAFLKFSGVGLLGTGAIMALSVGIKALVGPLVGHLVGQAKSHELRWGAALYVPAWAALFLPGPLSVRLGIALLGFTAASQFYGIGTEAEAYGLDTAAGMAGREILLNLARLAVLALAAPCLFYSATAYAGLALVYAVATAGAVWWITRHKL